MSIGERDGPARQRAGPERAYDSRLVGRVVRADGTRESVPLSDVKVTLRQRSWWLRKKTLGEGLTNADGRFSLPFRLGEARSWTTASLRVEFAPREDDSASQDTPALQSLRLRARELADACHDLRTVEMPTTHHAPSPGLDPGERSDLPSAPSRVEQFDPAFSNEPSIEEVCRECMKKSRIRYRYRDAFFKPGTLRINHLEVGRSRLIHAPTTIVAELLYLGYEHLCDLLRVIRATLFPRRGKLHAPTIDSSVVGSVVHPSRTSDYVPIPNLEVELWGRTRWLRWRKLSEAVTAADGSFRLPFALRQASNWFTASVRFEIYTIAHIRYDEEAPRPHRQRIHTIAIPRGDLVGMRYNLRTIQLPFWEYRTDTETPRTRIDAVTQSTCEKYARGRVSALYRQLIPFQITKWKHLLQIRYAPRTITLARIQADYPENLTRCIEKRAPGYTRGDKWFGERLMNGMNRGCFFPAESPDHYWVKYYGVCDYDHNDEYALPDAAALLRITEQRAPEPVEIHLRGRLSAFDHEPGRLRVFKPEDGDDWQHAKRVLRVTGAVATEVDEHFAGTHLNSEQYSIAAHRNLRRNPVACLLLPHLKEVALINHSADGILIKGYLPRASALTAEGLSRRTQDILGVQDWKGWRPMRPLHDGHTCAIAETLFWERVVTPFVEEFFAEHLDLIKAHWREVYLFSEDLVAHSIPVFLSDVTNPTSEQRDRLAYYCYQYAFDPTLPRRTVDGRLRAVSPITTTEEFSSEDDLQNLKDVCRYAIMMATYMHTWINEHQYDDLGEVLYSCGGLRFGNEKRGILAPESDTAIAPDLARSTEMLWFTNFLSRTEYGFIARNEERDVHPGFRSRLLALRDEFARLGVDVTAIESRTNI